jgi:ribose 1,5-bisphosphokinase PhnN
VGHLIILRGPAGSGKDTIGKSLVEKLGGDNQVRMLDLDITGPLEQQFLEQVEESLQYKHVIGMLFWGGTHTENPDNWITKFKNRNYTIISVVLQASLQTLIQRVEKRGYNYKPPEEMKKHFDEFNQIKNIFADNAQVEEISIGTEGKNPEKVADEILSILMNP